MKKLNDVPLWSAPIQNDEPDDPPPEQTGGGDTKETGKGAG